MQILYVTRSTHIHGQNIKVIRKGRKKLHNQIVEFFDKEIVNNIK